MKNKFVFYIILLPVLKGFSQDPLFITTQQSLVYLNPSFAGSNGLLRTQSLYRAPVNNQKFSSTTLYNSIDAYVKPLKGGIAFTHVLDNRGQGVLKTNTYALSYARHFSLLDDKLKIIPSFQIAYLLRELDKSKLVIGGDPRNSYEYMVGEAYVSTSEVIPSPKKSNMDFSAGLLINHKNFYFGTSVFHISQPNDGLLGDSRLAARFVIHSSYSKQMNSWASINIFAQYQRQNKVDFGQVKINFLFVNHLIIGASYYSNNAASFNVGYKNKYFTLGLGYDQCLSNIEQQLNSAVEAQFSLNIRKKEHRNSGVSPESW